MTTTNQTDPLLDLACEVWGQAYCMALRGHLPLNAEVRANEALARFAARIEELRSTGIRATLARICHSMCEETLPMPSEEAERRYIEEIKRMVEEDIKAYEAGEDPDGLDPVDGQ